MGRAKLRMELIPKEKTRHTTYHKRKQGIIKKANEFTILCDVDTVIIIYPPNSDVPEIWPENADKIKKTIASYKVKKGDTGKRTYDLHDFYEDRKKKIEDELVKARKKNLEAKYATWFDELDGLTEGQLRQFAMRLENKENVVRAHLELKKKNMSNINIPIQFQPFMYDYENKMMGMGQYPGNSGGLDYGQVMGHPDVRRFGEAANMRNLFMASKREDMGIGYPVYDHVGMVYHDNGPSQWVFQTPMGLGGVNVMPEFVRQDDHAVEIGNNNNINNGVGVGEFVMDGYNFGRLI